ncbi:TPA: hypothetical protein ACH3X1_009368 [Trebouxia sp. C0004]
MLDTARRYSTQSCSAAISHSVYRRVILGAAPSSFQKTGLQGFLKRKSSSYVSILQSNPSKLTFKWRCMVSQRQETQSGTSNLLAFLNVINDSTKYVVTLAAGGVLVWHHDIYVSWCLLGSVVAVYVCKVFKTFLRRPDHSLQLARLVPRYISLGKHEYMCRP